MKKFFSVLMCMLLIGGVISAENKKEYIIYIESVNNATSEIDKSFLDLAYQDLERNFSAVSEFFIRTDQSLEQLKELMKQSQVDEMQGLMSEGSSITAESLESNNFYLTLDKSEDGCLNCRILDLKGGKNFTVASSPINFNTASSLYFANFMDKFSYQIIQLFYTKGYISKPYEIETLKDNHSVFTTAEGESTNIEPIYKNYIYSTSNDMGGIYSLFSKLKNIWQCGLCSATYIKNHPKYSIVYIYNKGTKDIVATITNVDNFWSGMQWDFSDGSSIQLWSIITSSSCQIGIDSNLYDVECIEEEIYDL